MSETKCVETSPVERFVIPILKNEEMRGNDMNLYPINAMRIDLSLRLNPFLVASWWLPTFKKTGVSELSKQQGEAIWYLRWLFLQVTYRRWV